MEGKQETAPKLSNDTSLNHLQWPFLRSWLFNIKGAAIAHEARTWQGADVQLPADIQPDYYLEGDRTSGARQAAATPALISELLTTAVSVYRRGHSTETACMSWTRCTQQPTPRSPHWLASKSRRASTPSTTMCVPAVSSHSSLLSALPPAGYTVLSPPPSGFSSSCVLADTRLLWTSATVAYRRVQCSARCCSLPTLAVGELIESYGVSYHQFAYDTQLLVSMNSTNATSAIDRLAHCSAAVHLWFLQNGLQLNTD